MDTSYIKMQHQPPLARGIITAFDEFIEEVRKIAIMSVLERFGPQVKEGTPPVFEEAMDLFSKLKEDSTTDDCHRFSEFVKSIPNEECMAHFEKETMMTDFFSRCRKLRDLVEHKLSLPLQQWKLEKQDAMQFSIVYARLVQELDEVRHMVEKARHLRDKVMPGHEAEVEKMKKQISAAEDFKSLHPFFIVANSEEHMEKITALRQKKIQELQEQQKIAEQNFKSAPLKFQNEIKSIIEESLKTKCFIEWLEERNYSKVKEYEVKMREEWNKFADEMEQSRNLGQTYREKHAVYLNLQREKADRERLEKQDPAARVLQALWRAYAAKKK